MYYIDAENTGLAARNLIVAVLYIFVGISVLGMVWHQFEYSLLASFLIVVYEQSISLMQEGATDNIYEFLRKLRVLKAVEEDTEESCEIIEIVNYHDVDEDENKEEEASDITSNNMEDMDMDMDMDKGVGEEDSDDKTP